MANVTIKKLAELVRSTPEHLKEQLKEAGVIVTSDDQAISDAEKRKLLLYLKNRNTAEKNPVATATSARPTIKLQSAQNRKTNLSSVVMQGKKNVAVAVRTKRSVNKAPSIITEVSVPTVEKKVKAKAAEATQKETEINVEKKHTETSVEKKTAT